MIPSSSNSLYAYLLRAQARYNEIKKERSDCKQAYIEPLFSYLHRLLRSRLLCSRLLFVGGFLRLIVRVNLDMHFINTILIHLCYGVGNALIGKGFAF